MNECEMHSVSTFFVVPAVNIKFPSSSRSMFWFQMFIDLKERKWSSII